MLKSKDEVVVLGLTSGMEIIGMVTEETDTAYRLSHVKQMAQGPTGIGLAQLSFLAAEDSVIEIKKASVLYKPETINAEFKDAFIKSTSPIAQPSQGIITK